MFNGFLSALFLNWALGVGVVATSIAVLWFLWSAARRHHFHSWPKFPKIVLLVVGMILSVPASCFWTLRPVPQPASLQTVVAIEVPLLTAAEKSEFVSLLSKEAQADGYHVDASKPDRLEYGSNVAQTTFSATVWRGDDEENIAAAMDYPGHLGRVWVTFAKGESPQDAVRFRQRLLSQIYQRWPKTRALPIMSTGAIPLVDDMTRTPSGYVVKPSAASRYAGPNEKRSSP